MKKIISKRLYNTETATLIAAYSNGYSRRDFNFVREELYRKRTKEFFIFYEGGSLSIYSEQVGNCWTGSSGIIPLDDEKAKKWLADNGFTNEYCDLFGDIEE